MRYVEFTTEVLMPKPSLSFSATVILQAVASGYPYGFDIMDVTGLPSGTVYPALRRLEANGLVTSRWEDARDAQKLQRPPRKYYEMTTDGDAALAEALRRYRILDQTGAALERRAKPSRGEA
jgi:DNA-binding PadR family transcriptional regulator